MPELCRFYNIVIKNGLFVNSWGEEKEKIE